MTQEDNIKLNAKAFMQRVGWGKSSFTTIQVTRLLQLFAKEQVKLFALPPVIKSVCEHNGLIIGKKVVKCPHCLQTWKVT